jgi:hypothetical protein
MVRLFKGFVAHTIPKATFTGMPTTVAQLYEMPREKALIMAPQLKGLPIVSEHNDELVLGKVKESAVLPNGSWDATLEIDDSTSGGELVCKLIDNGLFCNLSLKHKFQTNKPVHLAVCWKGARAGTYIYDSIQCKSKTDLYKQTAQEYNALDIEVSASDSESTLLSFTLEQMSMNQNQNQNQNQMALENTNQNEMIEKLKLQLLQQQKQLQQFQTQTQTQNQNQNQTQQQQQQQPDTNSSNTQRLQMQQQLQQMQQQLMKTEGYKQQPNLTGETPAVKEETEVQKTQEEVRKEAVTKLLEKSSIPTYKERIAIVETLAEEKEINAKLRRENEMLNGVVKSNGNNSEVAQQMKAMQDQLEQLKTENLRMQKAEKESKEHFNTVFVEFLKMNLGDEKAAAYKNKLTNSEGSDMMNLRVPGSFVQDFVAASAASQASLAIAALQSKQPNNLTSNDPEKEYSNLLLQKLYANRAASAVGVPPDMAIEASANRNQYFRAKRQLANTGGSEYPSTDAGWERTQSSLNTVSASQANSSAPSGMQQARLPDSLMQYYGGIKMSNVGDNMGMRDMYSDEQLAAKNKKTSFNMHNASQATNGVSISDTLDFNAMSGSGH